MATTPRMRTIWLKTCGTQMTMTGILLQEIAQGTRKYCEIVGGRIKATWLGLLMSSTLLLLACSLSTCLK
ncbi:hypothetical protein BDV98DRAFT_131821 [Pterulicium gracile]|uniref:Uncharacterized protein n=1 Tax=Pterulicium gracile TaxID=1884261 RepID=A0A5C3QC68_9AGAR|nr:hypothetical protein BDV98DRAFT_131821 [Pterula gracilis]